MGRQVHQEAVVEVLGKVAPLADAVVAVCKSTNERSNYVNSQNSTS